MRVKGNTSIKIIFVLFSITFSRLYLNHSSNFLLLWLFFKDFIRLNHYTEKGRNVIIHTVYISVLFYGIPDILTVLNVHWTMKNIFFEK